MGFRQKMLELGLAMIRQDDMQVFSIPHGQDYKRIVTKNLRLRDGRKYWADFVRDWLPQHPYTVVAGPWVK